MAKPLYYYKTKKDKLADKLKRQKEKLSKILNCSVIDAKNLHVPEPFASQRPISTSSIGIDLMAKPSKIDDKRISETIPSISSFHTHQILDGLDDSCGYVNLKIHRMKRPHFRSNDNILDYHDVFCSDVSPDRFSHDIVAENKKMTQSHDAVYENGYHYASRQMEFYDPTLDLAQPTLMKRHNSIRSNNFQEVFKPIEKFVPVDLRTVNNSDAVSFVTDSPFRASGVYENFPRDDLLDEIITASSQTDYNEIQIEHDCDTGEKYLYVHENDPMISSSVQQTVIPCGIPSTPFKEMKLADASVSSEDPSTKILKNQFETINDTRVDSPMDNTCLTKSKEHLISLASIRQINLADEEVKEPSVISGLDLKATGRSKSSLGFSVKQSFGRAKPLGLRTFAKNMGSPCYVKRAFSVSTNG